MKKTIKTVTQKKMKTKLRAGTTVNTAIKPKAGQEIKPSGNTKAKKVAKAKSVLMKVVIPNGAKPKTKAGVKPKTKAETEAKLKVRIKTEIKPSAKAKPVAKKKVAATVAPQKATAVAEPKLKAKVEKKSGKIAAPKKTTAIAGLKSPEIKVVSPAKKTVGIQKKKAAPATAAKKKSVALVPKKALVQAPKKSTLQVAEPAKKPKETPIKASSKIANKAEMLTAENAKPLLKKKMRTKVAPRLVKIETVSKARAGVKARLRPAAELETPKPEETPAKKVGKRLARLVPVTTVKPPIRKEARHVAKSVIKVKVSGVDKEPAREKQVQTVASVVGSLKETHIVRPAVPAVAEEAGNELLSVAEIEAREGRVIKPRLKIFLPTEDFRDENFRAKEDKPLTGRETLPTEYGESEFFMIVIDPVLIFFDWEIAREDFPAEGLPLCIRIYDVTGITFDGTNAHGFIDIDLEGHTGSGYCEIGMQGKEIVAEIGFVDAHGVFIAIMRSAKASVPPLLQYDELGIVKKMQEAGLPVGY